MVLSRILRAGEGKTLRRLKAIADAVNDCQADMKPPPHAELRGKPGEFRARPARRGLRAPRGEPRGRGGH